MMHADCQTEKEKTRLPIDFSRDACLNRQTDGQTERERQTDKRTESDSQHERDWQTGWLAGWLAGWLVDWLKLGGNKMLMKSFTCAFKKRIYLQWVQQHPQQTEQVRNLSGRGCLRWQPDDAASGPKCVMQHSQRHIQSDTHTSQRQINKLAPPAVVSVHYKHRTCN